MRDLNSDEINDLLKTCDWGTLLLVDGDKSYGIEVSHYIDEDNLCFIFNPGGKAAQCIANNQNVAYKVCQADLPKQEWSAVTVAGRIEKVTDPQGIYDAFIKLGKWLNRDMDKYKSLGQRYSRSPEKTPVHFLPIKNISGKASK